MPALKRKDLLYPDISYRIIGCAFDVYNNLGGGHHERFYQRALSKAFQENGLEHKEQVYFPLRYHDKIVGRQFLDFIVEGKIVVEIKKGGRYSKRHIDQVLEYLKLSKIKLAILINFDNQAVSFKRIVNFDS